MYPFHFTYSPTSLKKAVGEQCPISITSSLGNSRAISVGIKLLTVDDGAFKLINTPGLYLSTALEDIRWSHHAFIVHVVNGPAVAVSAGDTF